MNIDMRSDPELSSDRALEDFLRACLGHPVRVMLERLAIPRAAQRARDYDTETERLRLEMGAGA